MGMTWNEMLDMEPNLENLADRLQRFDAESDNTKQKIWSFFGKREMQKLVGNMAEPSIKGKRHPRINGVRRISLDITPATPPDPRMITSEAYDLAYKKMIEALRL